MSYDRQIDFACPHIVTEEALTLNADRVSIRPLRPISAANSVRVRVNGQVEVPSFGVHHPAEAFVSKRGPYNIRVAVNDTLRVRVDDGAEQTIVVPPGEGLTARDLARRVNPALTDAVLELTPMGRLRLRTRSKGLQATLMVRPSSLATTLGLPTNRQWRGRTPFSGWSLINDPNTLSDRPARLIVFDSPLLGFRDYVELDYATLRQECRRCQGLGLENDWRYGVDGQLFKVRDELLLIQEVEKAVYTIQGTNEFHPWYGTNLFNMVGQKLLTSGVVQTFIVNDIRDAFRRWQNVKRQQEGQEVGQFVSDEEFPYRLLDVKLTPGADPTVIFVAVTIQNRSQKPIVIDRGLPLPQALSNFKLIG